MILQLLLSIFVLSVVQFSVYSKGTLELHNLDLKLPFDTTFGLVGQCLVLSKADISAHRKLHLQMIVMMDLDQKPIVFLHAAGWMLNCFY